MGNHQGFTLIELLLIIALLALLSGIGSPLLADRLADYRLHSAALALASELRMVRSDAATHGKVYAVQVYNNYFVVRDGDAVVPTIIRSRKWPSGIRLHPDYGDNGEIFHYGALGFVNPFEADTIHLTDKRGKIIRVVVSAGGRVKIGMPDVK